MADPASSAASPEAPSTSSALSARWAVHKFGGTSLSTADCYRSAVDTVLHTAGVIDAKRNSTPRVPVFYPGATSATDSPLVSSATSTSLSLPELTLTPAASPSPSTSSPPSPEPPALRRTSSVGMYGAEWSAFEGVRQAVVVSAMGDVKPQPHLEEQAPELVGGLQKVTSLILEATRLASERKPEYAAVVEELRVRHERTVEELLGNAESKEAVLRLLRTELQDLQHILKAVWLNKRSPPESEAWWSGLGELWSARMMCAYFNHVSSPERVAVCMDARDVMVVKWSELGANPDIEATRVRLRAWLSQPHVQAARVVVVTGYIGRTIDGVPTTLGRDGSDVTASFLAALLQAESLTIWKDVDGVYSAHPGVVPDAILRTDISYHEAMELSYFGSKILHPKTMTPLVRNNVPVFIRNSFNTGVPGTSIHTVRSGRKTYFGVQGFSAKRDLAVVTLEATGLIGVLGIAHRAIKALAAVRCSVHMITQADSQHSICFAVLDSNADAVLASIQREFRVELEEGQVQTVQLTRGVACIAVVGDGMVHKIGVAGRVFGALAQKQINIIAIAQGSSERNISVLIDRNEADDALRAIHAAFVPVPHRMRIVLVVGSSELPFPHPPSDSGAPDSPRRSHGEMVSDLVERLIACGGTVRSSPVSVRVVGLVDVCRGQQLLQMSERRGLGVEHIKQFYASGAAGVQDRRVQVSPVNWEAVEQHLLPSSKVPSENQPRIIIDVTRTTPPLERYRHWASRGIHVISSNPFVHCIPLQQYTDLLHKNHLLHTTQTLSDSPPGEALTRARPSETLYHSFHNCPVSLLHNSLSSMLEALTLRGDTISRVECVVASPLSVLFNAYNPTRADRTLAAILKPSDASPAATWQKRVRSSNLMAACALVGTARVLGIPAEVEHVRVADFGATDASCGKWCASLFSTVEKEFNACENGVAADDKDDARLEELFAKLYAAAHENNKVLRFAATLDSERNMVVGVREFPRSHPFARMRSDTRHSCALIYTAQFGSANPIVLDIPASRNECSSAAAHTLVVAEIEALKNALVPAEGSNDKP